MSISRLIRKLTQCILITVAIGSIFDSASAQQKIGVSLPLSGQSEPLARQFLIGARLALQQISPSSGTAVELMVVDDACDETVAKLSAEEMQKAGVSIVTGLLCNNVAMVIANEMVAPQTPLLIAGARSERLIKDRARENWNLWRMSPGDDDAAKYAATIFGKLWQAKAYAIVDDGTVYGRNLADAFRSMMEDEGLPPQFQDNFRPTQSTQARLVRRLKNAGITHVFIGAAAEDVAMIAKNAKELNISLEIAGGEVLSIMPYLPQDQLPPDGILAIVEKTSADLELSQTIRTLLSENKIEPEPYVLAGYQAIEIALQALRQTPAETTTQLSTKTFDTLLGPVNFNSDGTSTAQQYGLYQWQNNQFVQALQ